MKTNIIKTLRIEIELTSQELNDLKSLIRKGLNQLEKFDDDDFEGCPEQRQTAIGEQFLKATNGV